MLQLFVQKIFPFNHDSWYAKCLQDPSSADDINQNDHDGNHQKNVNKTAHRIGTDQPKKPQYNQNNSDSVKHNNFPFLFRLSTRDSHAV